MCNHLWVVAFLQVLAECFLSTLQKYLKGLMADLKAYTITDVSAENDRVR